MKKEIFYDVCVLNCKKSAEIKTADFCNVNRPNKGDYLKILRGLKAEIDQKRAERAKRKEGQKTPLSERLNARKIARLEEAIRDAGMFAKYADGFCICNSNDYSCAIDFFVDWNYYAKSCRFPKTTSKVVLGINATKIPSAGEIVFDNIINVDIIEKYKKDNVLFYKTLSIVPRRSGATFETFFVASRNGIYYHSSKSYDQAHSGLEKKIKNAGHDAPLNKETLIGKREFSEITGACFPGIRNFCETFGVKARRMKIETVISLLEKAGKDYDCYKQSLIKAIEQ